MTGYVEDGPGVATTAPRLISFRTMKQTRAVAQAGRVTLVVLSVLAVYAAGREAQADEPAVVAGLSGAWLLALRFGRLVSPEALGPAVATTMGAFVGFVAVSAMSLWLRPVELSAARSLVMAAAVLLFVGIWESVVHRTTAARRRVLVVGTPLAADTVARESARADASVDVLGVVPDCPMAPSSCGVPIVGQLDGPARSSWTRSTRTSSSSSDGVDCDSTIDRLLDVPADGFRVVGYTSFFEARARARPGVEPPRIVVHEHPPSPAARVYALVEARVRHR